MHVCTFDPLAAPHQTTHHIQCACKDPNFKGGDCAGKCGSAQYKGDGNCDDENNNCGCQYDGGDCCGPNIKKTYCKEVRPVDNFLRE